MTATPFSHLSFRATTLRIALIVFIDLFFWPFPPILSEVINEHSSLATCFFPVSRSGPAPPAVSLNQSVKLIINQWCSLTSLFLTQAPLKACVSRSITSPRTQTTRRTLPSISYVSPVLASFQKSSDELLPSFCLTHFQHN